MKHVYALRMKDYIEEKIIYATRLLRKNLKQIQACDAGAVLRIELSSQQAGCVDNCEDLFFYMIVILG